MFKFIKDLAISGLICIVKIEFGQNPNVSLKNSESFLTSLLLFGGRGFTKGLFSLFSLFQYI